MHAESSLLAVVSAWGPSVVLLVAAVLAAVVVRRAWTPAFPGMRPGVPTGPAGPAGPLGSASWEALSLALDDAASMFPFDVGVPAGPDVYLSGIVRCAPSTYRDAVHELARHFSDGRSVSIDVGRMDCRQAVRLIDFCMGLAAGGSGWILRVSDRVIVLTPFRR